MTASELIAELYKYKDDTLVMLPERDGGAPSLVRSVELHPPVYSDQPRWFVWLQD